MDVSSKLVFSLLLVAWVAVVWLTDGRAILWVMDITTLAGDSRRNLVTWIFFRDDDSLRKPVLISFYGILLGLVWLT